MTASLVELEGIAKRFDNGFEALRNFSLRLMPGEFVSLIGPSGCGKSTVLSLVAGLDRPTGGQVRWRSDPAPHIGFVFQEPTLMPWATVADNVLLPLSLSQQTRDVLPLLAKVGLADFAATYPRQLSGGMKMRVSLARALAAQPALLLLDEPFGALDEITRFGLIEQLLNLWGEQSFTSLFVTHSITESVFMSQRVIVMGARPGRILAEIPIDVPFPRPDSFRATAIYADYCGQVLTALRDASGGPR